MGCNVQKSTRSKANTKISKSSSSPYLICSTEAKIQSFIQTLSHAQIRDKSKSIRCQSPLQTHNSSNSIRKQDNVGWLQHNSQKVILDLRKANQHDVDHIIVGLTPQFGRKKVKSASSQIKQISWNTVDQSKLSQLSFKIENGSSIQENLGDFDENSIMKLDT